MSKAQCAVDENRKLKQENAELKAKYEKETLENKIKTLEMQNEIQTLKHQMEISKLKSQQVENEENKVLKDEVQTLKHQMEIVETKIQSLMKDTATKDEMNTKVQALANDVEQMKANVAQIQSSKDYVVKFKRDFENFKTETKQNNNAKVEVVQNASEEPVLNSTSNIPDRFFEGAEKLLKGNVQFLNQGYRAWYEDMSQSMRNRIQYVNKKFVLIRKDVKGYYASLWFAAKQRESKCNIENNYELIVEGLYERLTFLFWGIKFSDYGCRIEVKNELRECHNIIIPHNILKKFCSVIFLIF